MASPNHLLIDGDILLYNTTSACKHEADWGDAFVTVWFDKKEFTALIDTILSRWCRKFDTEDFTICLSDYHDPFRKRIDPTYKEQREGNSKPTGYQWAHETLPDMYPCASMPSLEADDVMGIMSTSGEFERPIIISEDKDMRQIPGTLYVPRRDELVETTPHEGYRYHMLQTLVGDRVDNYPGCRGIGEVRAERILTAAAAAQLDFWVATVRAYRQSKQGDEFALRQARLSKILQHEDYDFEQQEPILWTPSTNIPSSDATTVDTKSPQEPSAATSKNGTPAPTPGSPRPTPQPPLRSTSRLRKR